MDQLEPTSSWNLRTSPVEIEKDELCILTCLKAFDGIFHFDWLILFHYVLSQKGNRNTQVLSVREVWAFTNCHDFTNLLNLWLKNYY